VKQYNSRVAVDPNSLMGPGEAIAILVSMVCTFGGALVHVVNLDMDPRLRSSAFGFLAANVGIGYMFWAGIDEDWVEHVPILIVLVFAGVVLGLLVSEGDVQKETKEAWRAESESAKRKETKAGESSDSTEKKDGGKDASRG
jgi:hypothetical protein